MSQIKVNAVTDRFDSGAPTLPNSAIIPSGGTLVVNGNVNNTGISTISTVEATQINSTTMTAQAFVGDGSQLTGLPIVSQSKVVALKMIIDPLPFRS